MKVLNFGSLNIDYVYHLDHFVNAGETINSSKLDVNCGGKGLNQSVAIKKAGLDVYHAGMVGKDDSDILMNTLNQYSIDSQFVHKADCLSGHAIIQVTSKGENSIILFGGANRLISEDFVCTVLDNFNEGDFCVLQNEINLLPFIMQKAKKRGIKIILNPSPCNQEILNAPLELVDIFLINEVEGEQIAHTSDPHEIINILATRFNKADIVLTLGKKGVMYRHNDKVYSCGIYDDVKVVDTTAAGDTFTGYFLSAIISGLSPQETLTLASAASSIAVSKNGASISIPLIDEVMEFVASHEPLQVDEYILR